MSQVECHYCNERKDKASSQSFMARCCVKKCNKYYCMECIRSHFNPDFEPSFYRKDTWICFNCQSKCNCPNCKAQQANLLERKASRRKTSKNQISKGNEESGDVQSVGNMSMTLNTNRAQEMSGAGSLTVNLGEEEMQVQENVIGDYKVHEKMLIGADQIIMMPFFLQKMARRKNMYYEFMSRRCKENEDKKEGSNQLKTKEPISDKKLNSSYIKIKQMIDKALDERMDDSEQIDIVPLE